MDTLMDEINCKSEPAIEASGADARHQPYFGSVLEYQWKQRGVSMEATGIPVNMVLSIRRDRLSS